MLRQFYGTALRARAVYLKKKQAAYIERLKRRGLNIGVNVAINEPFFLDPDHCYLISIGDNCSLAPNVRLIAHDASTKRLLGCTKIGRITIGENCFLGDSVIVLPNVTIGPDAIVGAGAVVVKDVPPGTVVGGNPAKVICKIDDYAKKYSELKAERGVFSEDFLIENLNEQRRKQMLTAAGAGVGFIV